MENELTGSASSEHRTRNCESDLTGHTDSMNWTMNVTMDSNTLVPSEMTDALKSMESKLTDAVKWAQGEITDATELKSSAMSDSMDPVESGTTDAAKVTQNKLGRTRKNGCRISRRVQYNGRRGR